MNKYTTSLIGILTVIIITLFFKGVLGIDIAANLIALWIICRFNKDFQYRDCFLWTFLTYIIGSTLALLIIYLLYGNISLSAINYSTFTYGNIRGNFPDILNWITKFAILRGTLTFQIILSLYKGIFLAVANGLLVPNNRTKHR